MDQNRTSTQTNLANLTPVQQEAITMLVEHAGDAFWQPFNESLKQVISGDAQRLAPIERRGQYLAVNKSSDSGQSRR